MAKVKNTKASFSMGVFSPNMAARVDLEQYYRAAKTIKNGVVLPQGGVTKRNGFKLLADVAAHIGGAIEKDGVMLRVIPYTYDGAAFIIILSSKGTIEVFTRDGDQVMAATDISSRSFGDAIESTQYKQMVNDLVIMNPYFKPFNVLRKKDGTFAIQDIPNLVIPKVDFDDKMTGNLWDKINLSFDQMVNGDTFVLGYRQDNKETQITYNVTQEPLDGSVTDAGDNAEAMAADIAGKLNAIQSGHTVAAVYETVKRQVINNTKQMVEVNLRIFKGFDITKPDANKMLCKSKSSHIAKVTTKPIGGTYTEDTSTTLENAWTDNRGWPSVGGEHGGRFIMAGSLSFPETVWMSKIYQYYNFEIKDTGIVATDAIQITLATERASKITGIIDARRLTVITDRTAYTLEGEGDTVITPDSIRANNINQKGAKLIRPEMLDNYVFYVQDSAAELNSMAYDFATDSYLSTQASIYSAHLLRDIQQMSKTISSGEFNAEYLTVLNRDGSLANYSLLREQQLQNWTEFETKGKVIDIVGIGSEVYAVVRRGIAGQTALSLERMDEGAMFCDYSKYYISSTPFESVGGYESFIGENLVAVADGYDIDLLVEAGGLVNLPFAAKELVIGLPMDFEVEPMPIELNLQSGASVNSRKRISEAKLTLLNSRDVTLEYGGKDYMIADRQVGFKLGEPPQPYTGVKTKRLTGYINQGNVKIKSNKPVDVTVLGIETKVQLKG